MAVKIAPSLKERTKFEAVWEYVIENNNPDVIEKTKKRVEKTEKSASANNTNRERRREEAT